MTNPKEREDLELFLRNVDEVDSIIKDLAANNQVSIERADEFLEKYEKKQISKGQHEDGACVNRTVINQGAFDNWDNGKQVVPHGGADNATKDSMDQAAFMAAMEEDCRDRAERRKERTKKAEQMKELGNTQFALGYYEKAVDLYTSALNEIRDWTVLWTNRAQANMKLGKFEAALEDCTWAFKVEDKCLKAAVLEGKAHLGLKAYDKARDSYARALKIAPDKESLIRNYVMQVKLAEDAEMQEKSAQELFNVRQHTGLVSLFEKLKKPDQSPMYYTGGLQIIRKAVKDLTDQTLFRTSGGLTLGQTHPVISQCLLSSDPNVISILEGQMLASYLEALLHVCIDNEVNQHEVLSLDFLPPAVIRYLESKSKASRFVAYSALELLLYLSQTAYGRSEIVSRYDVVQLISITFASYGSHESSSSNSTLNAQRLITNIAMDPKFRRKVYDGFESHVLTSFEAFLASDTGTSTEVTNTLLTINMMINLCGDAWLRRKAAERFSTWNACLAIVTRHVTHIDSNPASCEVISSILGLLANMSVEGVPKNVEDSEGDDVLKIAQMVWKICSILCELITKLNSSELLEHCYLLLSRLLKTADSDPKIIELVCDHGLVGRTIEFIQQGTSKSVTKSGIASLAVCTLHRAEPRQQIVDFPKGLKAILGLLTDSDDVVVGNAALCLAHCVQLRRACRALTKTNIIMDLLVLARDQSKPTVQHNCAIAIAKLAQGDQKHLDRLRELHGIEILNTVLKHVDS